MYANTQHGYGVFITTYAQIGEGKYAARYGLVKVPHRRLPILTNINKCIYTLPYIK